MLLLVLPWGPGTFDRTRKPSNIFEILTGHILPSRQRLVHGVLDALVAGWSAPAASSSDPASTVDDGSRGSREATPWWAQQALAQQRKPEGWERDMHWHVFDFATIAELLRCLGFGVEAMELVEPYHMVVVGRKIELPPPPLTRSAEGPPWSDIQVTPPVWVNPTLHAATGGGLPSAQ